MAVGTGDLAGPRAASLDAMAVSSRRLRLTLATLAVAGLVSCQGSSGTWPRQERGVGAGGVAFVSSQACAACHGQQYTAWLDSHHFASMQPANQRTVLGDFSGVETTHFGVTSRFFKRNEEYFVRTEGPAGRPADFAIRYTFGADPLQQYLIEFPGGRLQCLTIAWDSQKNRWFHLYPDERITADDPLHWTGLYQTWNHMCAECHSTNLRKNYDPDRDRYETAWDEVNVGCEACHGPAATHVEWARNRDTARDRQATDYGLQVRFSGLDASGEIDSCARCHSRRHRVGPHDVHSRPFLDDFLVETLREDLYYPDGQVLEEVYVYGSFLQSKMHREGVRCTDCHNPHRGSPRSESNSLCTRCHQTAPPQDFPTLKAKDYDTAGHHYHAKGSDGSQCVNCHMPAKTFMVVDPRRDHSFRVPRPDLSVKLDTPNACNTCHEDKSSQWAADAVAGWYGRERSHQPHFAETILAGRRGDRDAKVRLIGLALDKKQPAIVRATGLELLQGYGEDGLAAMAVLTKDENALVRTKAVAGLDGLDPSSRVQAAAPLLDDPIRAVRVEAARVLSALPAKLSSEQREKFDSALEEFRETQQAMLDTPAAWLNLAVLASSRGQAGQAEADYRRALKIDPYFVPAALNLSTLYAEQERFGEAEGILRGGIEKVPQQGELHYSLGLLLAEANRVAEAADSLELAAQLIPQRARVNYNYGLALQQLGRLGEAEKVLLEADRVDPSDPDIVYAVTLFYIRQRQFNRALPYAERLARLAPDAPGQTEMLRTIRSRISANRSDRSGP